MTITLNPEHSGLEVVDIRHDDKGGPHRMRPHVVQAFGLIGQNRMGAACIQQDQLTTLRGADVVLALFVDRQEAVLRFIVEDQVYLRGADIHLVGVAMGIPG